MAARVPSPATAVVASARHLAPASLPGMREAHTGAHPETDVTMIHQPDQSQLIPVGGSLAPDPGKRINRC